MMQIFPPTIFNPKHSSKITLFVSNPSSVTLWSAEVFFACIFTNLFNEYQTAELFLRLRNMRWSHSRVGVILIVRRVGWSGFRVERIDFAYVPKCSRVTFAWELISRVTPGQRGRDKNLVVVTLTLCVVKLYANA